MGDVFQPAIQALQTRLSEQERRVIETKTLINRLCEEAGDPPMYPDAGAPSQATITAIRGDTFYGKSVTTAAREYLEMRYTARLGPASPREIFEALVKGGYQFETEDENNAMTGIRAVMRKNSSIFHRLPNGQWGLLVRYPGVKASKDSAKESKGAETGGEQEEEVESKAAAGKKAATA